MLTKLYAFLPSSQPPQYVPPSSKSNRPPFICALTADASLFAAFEFDVAFTPVVAVDAEPGEFGATLNKIHINFIKLN